MAIMEILRNLARRKLRSALTISGIVIGIFALTTMGAMAEHFNAMLDQGQKFFSTAVSVGPPAGQSTPLIPLSKAQALGRVPGVTGVDPKYELDAAPGSAAASFGPGDMVINEAPGLGARTGMTSNIATGHDISTSTNGQVLLGPTIATDLKAHVGDRVYLPKKPSGAPRDFATHPFKVVGIMAATGNWTDSVAFVSTPDARMLFADSLPSAVRQSVDVTQYAQGFNVYGQPNISLDDLDALAARINQDVPGVKASKPSDTVNAFKSTGTIFTAVMTGAALLALIIGGLSVVNTMIMAVTERVREIGLKKALGAHTANILREYLLEATLIGLIGGVAGYLLGLGLTTSVNYFGRASNLNMFLVTPRLTGLGISFAVVMATLAGIIPAFRAARLDPVAALRNAG